MKQQNIDVSDIKMPDGLPAFSFYPDDGTYEIAVSLFKACNLKCSFCFEQHDGRPDKSYILSLPDKIVLAVESDVRKNHPTVLYVRVWGGELFFDAMPNEIFGVYDAFETALYEKLLDAFPFVKDVYFTWSTNGVFSKAERIEKLLESTDAKICFSYDPCGRFRTEIEKAACIRNIWRFYRSGRLGGISMTLTRNNIHACIDGEAGEFVKMARKIPIDLNAYIANKGYEVFLPTAKEVGDFYVWCVEKGLTNVSVIHDALHNMQDDDRVRRRCRCKLRTVFLPDGSHTHDCVNECSNLPAERFYGEYAEQRMESNVTEIKNTLGILKAGCLYCQRFSYCPAPCWASLIFDETKTGTCPYERMFRAIEEEQNAERRSH